MKRLCLLSVFVFATLLLSPTDSDAACRGPVRRAAVGSVRVMRGTGRVVVRAATLPLRAVAPLRGCGAGQCGW